MIEDRKIIEMNIADTIMERPYGFRVNKRHFYLYPITLGKTYLLSRLIESLDMKADIIKANPYMEALRLCQEKKETVCQLLSYHTLNKKEELFNNRIVNSRCQFLRKNLSNEEMANFSLWFLLKITRMSLSNISELTGNVKN